MKGILFNTKMVQAILENRKRATRRPIKPQPPIMNDFVQSINENGIITIVGFGKGIYTEAGNDYFRGNYKPKYKIGDILWVRETWQRVLVEESEPDIYGYVYKASPETFEDYGVMKDEEEYPLPWRPSIHMPKSAARIFLEVTNVKAERLQDITVEQIKKEGVLDGGQPIEIEDSYADGVENWYKALFENLWNSTIKKQDIDKYSWQANPYVWVYEFKRVDKPEVTDG